MKTRRWAPAVMLTFALGLGGAKLGAQQGAVTPPASGFSEPEPVPTTLTPNLVAPAAPGSFIIGVNDLLSIFVFQVADATCQVRVDTDGNIELPILYRPVQARGLASAAVAAAVAQELTREGMAVNPRVSVVVREVASRPVVVSGDVRNPMVIQAVRPLSLIEAISRAGGPAASAGDTILVSDSSGEKSYSLEQLMSSVAATPQLMLNGGETIRVTPAKLVYAMGALQRPGAFPLQAGQPLTILNAIALAQGFSTTTPPDRKGSEIIRTRADGERQVVPVNLNDLLDRKIPDQALLAGDILYVPESNKRKLLSAVLADAGQAAVITIGYGVYR